VQALGASPRTNLKLKFGQQQPKNPQIKLNFNAGRSTPNPTGGVIDNESLQRQREETGQALNRANRAGSRYATTNGSTPGPASIKRSGSVAGSSDHPSSVVMTEEAQPISNHSAPAFARGPVPGQAHISKSLPTPAMDGQPPPSFAASMTNGGAHSEIAYPQTGNRTLLLESDNPIDRKFRDAGKGEQALIP